MNSVTMDSEEGYVVFCMDQGVVFTPKSENGEPSKGYRSLVPYYLLDEFLSHDNGGQLYENLDDNFVNLKIKIVGTDDVLIKKSNVLLRAIQTELGKQGYKFNIATDVFVTNDEGYRCLLIRGKDFCFASRKDVVSFLNSFGMDIDNSLIDCCDFSIYSDRFNGRNNKVLRPLGKADVDYKKGLMTYVTKEQHRVIQCRFPVSKGEKAYSKKVVSEDEIMLWKGVHDGIRILDKCCSNGMVYLYFDGYCMVCGDEHAEGETVSYIKVQSTKVSIVDIKFRCMRGKDARYVCVTRRKISEVAFSYFSLGMDIVRRIKDFYRGNGEIITNKSEKKRLTKDRMDEMTNQMAWARSMGMKVVLPPAEFWSGPRN